MCSKKSCLIGGHRRFEVICCRNLQRTLKKRQHVPLKTWLAMYQASRHKLKLKLKIIYDRQSVGQSDPGVRHPSGTRDQFFFLLEIFFRQLRVYYFVAPSQTRGRVCNLLYNCFWAMPEQSLLGRSPAELTVIFYCLI
jgi:hypothetical protein